MDEDVVASACPPELEAERLDEPTHIREGDVCQVAASEPREEPLRIHGATLQTSEDEVLQPRISMRCRTRGRPRRSRLATALQGSLSCKADWPCPRSVYFLPFPLPLPLPFPFPLPLPFPLPGGEEPLPADAGGEAGSSFFDFPDGFVFFGFGDFPGLPVPV